VTRPPLHSKGVCGRRQILSPPELHSCKQSLSAHRMPTRLCPFGDHCACCSFLSDHSPSSLCGNGMIRLKRWQKCSLFICNGSNRGLNCIKYPSIWSLLSR